MVELQSSNLKLKQRARNIIRTVDPAATSLTNEQLDTAIQSCNGNVKLALMHLMSGLDVEESARRLAENGGVLKRAIEEWKNKTATITPTPSAVSDAESRRADLVLCIDGGGSKCAISVADRSGNLGNAVGGSCNFTDLSLDSLKDVITSTTALAVTDYLSSLGKTTPQPKVTISAVLAGFSGFDRPGASGSIRPMLASALSLPSEDCVEVMADTDLLASVLTRHPSCNRGVVLIAGTGSVAMSFARDPISGRFIRTGRSGGWGHVLGDEGSGFDIGRNGVRATLRAVERRSLPNGNASPLTPFHVAVIEKLVGSAHDNTNLDLLSKVLQADDGGFYDLKARMASIAPVVLAHTPSDFEAALIASNAAGHLVALLENLSVGGRNDGEMLVLAGGVMKWKDYRAILLCKMESAGLVFSGLEVVEEPASAAVMAMNARKLAYLEQAGAII